MTAYSLLGQAVTPNHLDTYTGSTVNGVVFSVSSAVTLTGLWFYSYAGAGQLPAEVGVFAGSGPAEVFHDAAPSWLGAAGSGWVKYSCSYALAAGTYTAAAWNGTPGGLTWYAITSAAWGPVTSGPLSCTADPDVYQDPASSWQAPASPFGAYNIFVDVEVTTAAPGSGLLMAAGPP